MGRTENGEKKKVETGDVPLAPCILAFYNHRLNQQQIKNIPIRKIVSVLNARYFYFLVFISYLKHLFTYAIYVAF